MHDKNRGKIIAFFVGGLEPINGAYRGGKNQFCLDRSLDKFVRKF